MRHLERPGQRRLLVVVTVAVGFTVLGAGCHRSSVPGDETGASPALPKRVRCAAARTQSMQDTLDLHGTVAPLPDRDAQIAGQVAGRILRVLVREGDRVTRDQPLAQIDAAALRDQSKQVAAQLAKAHTETVLAQTSRTRIQRVFDRGIAARQELDDAVARQSTAEANEAEARASAQITNRQLERATVRSPLAGVVLKVFHRTGELVDGTAGTPIVEVGDPSSLELVATATAAELVAAKVGAAATVEIPSVPGLTLAGTVAAVSPTVDRITGLGVVRVALILTDQVPPVGVSGTAQLAVGHARMAVVVPALALRGGAGASAELVVCGTDGHAHVVLVTRGARRGASTEILPAATDGGAAFSAGTLVAIDPVLGIEDGESIERTP